MKKIAFITGASAGIGAAIAERLAHAGYDLVLAARRFEKLEVMAKELAQKYTVRALPIALDVCDRAMVEKTIASLSAEWSAIDVLVNNAGLAQGREPIQNGDPAGWDTMIDTNLKGLLYVTHAVLPQMVARKSGHIVNLSSVAGLQPYENGNVYCATKHAVKALSDSMRIDLLKFGIKVTTIYPGLVKTEFATVRYHGDAKKVADTYTGYEPLLPGDIAEAVEFAVTRSRNVEIADMVITPLAQADSNHLYKA